ncbi:hypothetical protein LTR86_000737 [Recurvomyces mirabilis]|nr:hypothetical protein LTR86_000737 [Recurvomyces mirabilis]
MSTDGQTAIAYTAPSTEAERYHDEKSTPRASLDCTGRKNEMHGLSESTYDSLTDPPDSDDTKTLTGSVSHILSPSSIAGSQSYAPSTATDRSSTHDSYASPSIIEQRALFPGHRPRPRQSSVDSPGQKTTTRKAFVGFCHAVNVVIPVDVDEETTSMHGSTLAKAFHNKNGQKFDDDAALTGTAVQGRWRGL